MQEEEKKDSPPSTDDSPKQEVQLNNTSPDETIATSVETSTEADLPVTHNLSTEALAKVGPQPVTEQDMEVHHHSH